MECGVVGTVLWNLSQSGQLCGMLSCGDISMECAVAGTVVWNVSQCGMLSWGDSSMECGVVGTVLLNLGRCGQFRGKWGKVDSSVEQLGDANSYVEC